MQSLVQAKEGYQGWEGITVGNTVYYCITDSADWEVGYGQYLSRAGTPTIQRNVLSSSNNNEKLELSGNSSIFCTYPSEKAVFLNADDNIYYPTSNVTANNFVGKGNGITNINADANSLAPEAPTDGETYARNNKTWVSITDTAGIPDAPVDGLQYGRQDGEWTEVESTDAYTKSESDVIDNAQDAKIVINNDEIARQQIEITNNSSEIGKNTSAINTNITNIASNTTAIGTLSGQVSQNSEDIAELQDSIFFSSAYSADYPSAPNRDPEDGNMYLQNLALFTYSYANATQIFASKTDESGNVRQFTAIQAGDSIVLNEVDSPNYGRYELVTVEDVSDSYVVMNVIPKKGQGTVITGVKVAFQAFPKPDSGGGSIWTDVGGVATYDGDVATTGKFTASGTINTDVSVNCSGVNLGGSFTSGSGLGYDEGNDSLSYSSNGGHRWTVDGGTKLILDKDGSGNGQLRIADLPTTTNSNPANVFANSSGKLFMSTVDRNVFNQDITVNGITVGRGSGNAPSNVVVGPGAFNANVSGTDSVAIGQGSLGNAIAGIANTGVGENSLAVTTGNYNTSIGRKAGDTLTTGNNNTLLGHDAQPSSPGVSNEVTIGSDAVTKTRLNGNVVTTKDMTVNGLTVGQGQNSGANNTAYW